MRAWTTNHTVVWSWAVQRRCHNETGHNRTTTWYGSRIDSLSSLHTTTLCSCELHDSTTHCKWSLEVAKLYC